MIGLPSVFEKHVESKAMQKLLTGASIAIIESFIICPFERLKTYFMTVHADQRSSFSRYYDKSRGLFIQDLFKGLGPLVCRQLVAWIYFLQADLFMRSSLRNIYKVPDNESIPSRLLMPASMVVAVFSTFIIMPFDTLKTHKQLWETTGQTHVKGYKEICKGIYEEAGLRGFFVGWRLRFSLYLIHALLTIELLEKLELKAR